MSKWRRSVVLTAAVLLLPLSLGHIQAALACTCVNRPPTYESDVAAADVVFDAVPTQRSTTSADPNAKVTYRFAVSGVVKGSVTDPQDVDTSANGGLCGMSFDIGRAYRVFATRSGAALSTGSCSGDRLLAGYRLAAKDGGVFTFGASGFFGSAGGLHLNAPVVGMAATPSNRGYWLVAADGGVFTYGDAGFFGSAGGLRLVSRVVAITPTPTGRGYWVAAADGGVFSYGDAHFFGSLAGVRLSGPVVGITATGSGAGYWVLGADGGVFSFGDARYYGREASMATAAPRDPARAATSPVLPPPNQQATGITTASSGNGYWISSYFGGLAGFGDVGTLDPHPYFALNATVGVARASVAQGLAVTSSEGRVITFDAGTFGDLGGRPLNAPVVAISA